MDGSLHALALAYRDAHQHLLLAHVAITLLKHLTYTRHPQIHIGRGIFHELGHNHQAGPYGAMVVSDSTVEVTCNWFSIYISVSSKLPFSGTSHAMQCRGSNP